MCFFLFEEKKFVCNKTIVRSSLRLCLLCFLFRRSVKRTQSQFSIKLKHCFYMSSRRQIYMQIFVHIYSDQETLSLIHCDGFGYNLAHSSALQASLFFYCSALTQQNKNICFVSMREHTITAARSRIEILKWNDSRSGRER